VQILPLQQSYETAIDALHNASITCHIMSAEKSIQSSPKTATLIGFGAVLTWGLLAFFSKLAGDIPPLQITGMAFTIGGLVGVASWPFRPGASQVLFQSSPIVWIHNVAGLFGAHFLYFMAVQRAPVLEVSLIAYLWPLFIVLFAGLLPGEKLKTHHLAGAALGLVGAWFVVSKGQSFGLSEGLKTGHLIALPYALYWSAYSVSIRRYGKIPSDIVAGFCLVTGVLAGFSHLALESTVWPLSGTQWIAIIGLGVLPLGLGFYAWDFGMKHGDPMILGASAYAAPLLSTLVLLLAGFAELHWSIIAACLFITVGAVIAAKDMIFKP
jgi:drug/metabolite transporter (DMT)-like permease